MPFIPTCAPQGVAVKEPTIAPYAMKQLCLSEPDGYGLCFQWKANS